MHYSDLFTSHHIAMLHDWLTTVGGLFVRLEFPHSGGSGTSYSVTSLEELEKLVSQQTHPELEIFIFKSKRLAPDELDHRLNLNWSYMNSDKVLYLAVKKNRSCYDAYHKNPQKYKDVVAKWVRGQAVSGMADSPNVP
jgi:hypothetical protein